MTPISEPRPAIYSRIPRYARAAAATRTHPWPEMTRRWMPSRPAPLAAPSSNQASLASQPASQPRACSQAARVVLVRGVSCQGCLLKWCAQSSTIPWPWCRRRQRAQGQGRAWLRGWRGQREWRRLRPPGVKRSRPRAPTPCRGTSSCRSGADAAVTVTRRAVRAELFL